MPIAPYTKAAAHHQARAKAHKAAAELNGKGGPTAAIEAFNCAYPTFDIAPKVTIDVHTTSTAHAKK